MRIKTLLAIGVLCGALLMTLSGTLFAQGELAAVLEVQNGGVEVRRVNTQQWIPVNIEAIVGVGDDIRTDDTGRAKVIFFADGTETELRANTLFHINSFEAGDAEDSFTISAAVLAGQTIQRVNRIIDSNSSYDVETPGMDLVVRGTEFRLRVDEDGRSAMLVDEGVADAGAEGASADVPPGFGIRSEAGSDLSDVVPATNFAELDAALDGCDASLQSRDDVRLNVRQGPSRNSPLSVQLPPRKSRT